MNTQRQRMRVTALLSLCLLLGPLLPTAAATDNTSAAPPSAPYLTLMFSRLQLRAAEDCGWVTGAVPLDTRVAPELARRGLTATGTIVVNYLGETTRRCRDDVRRDGSVVRPRAVIYGSWADAAKLRDSYGWTFVSHSRSYRSMTTLTSAQAREESCGSLSAFTSRGHTRADGLFSYPNNYFTTALQRDIVSSCFAYGRVYGGTPNARQAMSSPWFARGRSLNGGRCNDPALPCSTLATPQVYDSPVALRSTVAGLGPDQWFMLQAYRFVTGSRAGAWDCTGSDWRRHWTMSTENYCWVDYLRILDGVNAATVVTDPKSVAQSWGRTP